MKVCTKCGKSEPKATFSAQRNQCKECRKAYLRGYYSKNESYFAEYRTTHAAHINKKSVECQQRSRHERYTKIHDLKRKPCLDCGNNYPPCVMDFDHRDPSTKVNTISTMVKTYVPWPKILEEIDKCDLVCACCHRVRTHKGDSCYRTHLYRSNRAMVDSLKTGAPCVDCGAFFKACQMDFDHVQKWKFASVSQMLQLSEATVLEEISKCELVCANCHRVRTYENPSPKVPKKLVLSPEAQHRERGRYVRVEA
jgi:hypothetical protein